MYCIGGTPTSCTWTTERLPIGTLHGTGKTDQNLHSVCHVLFKLKNTIRLPHIS